MNGLTKLGEQIEAVLHEVYQRIIDNSSVADRFGCELSLITCDEEPVDEVGIVDEVLFCRELAFELQTVIE